MGNVIPLRGDERAPGWMGASTEELFYGKAPASFKDGYAELQHGVTNEACRSPLIHHYASRIVTAESAGRPWYTMTPQDALAERETVCDHLLIEPSKHNEVRFPAHIGNFAWVDPDPVWRHRAKLCGLSILLSAAEVFLWKTGIVGGAVAMTLPDHLLGREGFSLPFQWWNFESQLNFQTRPPGDPAAVALVGAPIESLLLVRFPARVLLIYQFAPTDALGGKVTWEVYDAVWGDRISNTHQHAWILKLVAFLNSKYVDSNPQRLPRGTRRAMKRVGQDKERQEIAVRVVELRTKEAATASSEESEADGPARDWAGRWWVRGHIRAQWFPSTKTHKVIWIAPHLKGPEDKEILGRVYRVAR